MKSLALVGPFVIWLALAVPLNCHHGTIPPWEATGHVHQTGPLAAVFQGSPDSPRGDHASSPFNCQVHDSVAGTPMAYGALDTGLDSRFPHAFLEHSFSKPVFSNTVQPPGLTISPPDKPPTYSA